MRQEPVDLVGAAVVVAASALAVVAAGRLRTEPLVRRADLVSQLHFAVTMQDLRTVVLLRRQLHGERARTTAMAARSDRPATDRAVWWRSWRGLLRYPLARLARMAIARRHGRGGDRGGRCAARRRRWSAWASPSTCWRSTPSSRCRRRSITPTAPTACPGQRGWLLVHLLAAPAVALIPFAVIGGVTVAVLEPDAAVFVAALCVPITLAGACGAVVSVVRDAPDPLSPPVASSAAVPPEFAGFTTTLRLLWPLAISTLAGLGVLATREQPTAGTAVRIAVAAALVVAATALWVRRRDEWRVRIRAFLAEGRA